MLKMSKIDQIHIRAVMLCIRAFQPYHQILFILKHVKDVKDVKDVEDIKTSHNRFP